MDLAELGVGEPGRVERLAGNVAELGNSGQDRKVGRMRRDPLQGRRDVAEEIGRSHPVGDRQDFRCGVVVGIDDVFWPWVCAVGFMPSWTAATA